MGDPFEERKKKIESAIKEVFAKESMDKYAKDLASQIKKRTRLGFGIDKQVDGKQGRLLKLSSKYKEKRVHHSGNLHSDTNPSRSNLTATGQMLDALDGEGAYSKIIIFIKKERKTELDGRPSKQNNIKVKDSVEKSGRKFFGITLAEKKKFIREIRQSILDKLK